MAELCPHCDGTTYYGLLTKSSKRWKRDCKWCIKTGKKCRPLEDVIREYKAGGALVCVSCDKGTTGVFTKTAVFGFFPRSCAECKGTGKITNASDVQKRRLTSDMFFLFHGTNTDAALQIRSSGFKASSAESMFGSGVYVTGDMVKAKLFAMHAARQKGYNPCLLVVLARVGKCKTHDATGCAKKHKPGCSCMKWKEEGYDSQYAPCGEGVQREETVISDPTKVTLLRILY